MIGALINLTLLAVIGLYLVYEGVKRFIEPQEIVGWLMAATAVLALVVETVERIDGVSGMHHVHIWELDEQHRALEAHVLLQRGNPDELESIKRQIKQALADDFQVQHSTLEFEYEGVGEDCHDQQIIADH
jgi:cobalt-zinc-cadmium efflux system protein